MKRCPLCDKKWEDEKVFCPWDGHRLKVINNDDPLRSQDRPVDKLQFELMEEVQNNRQSFEESLSGKRINPSESQRLLDVALEALQKRRDRDQDLVREQMKLLEKFNLNCRVMQYFIDTLSKQSGAFRFKIDHSDETNRMWMRFSLSFGEGRYMRTFPVNVIYTREPNREVAMEINLYEISDDPDKRHMQTEKAGGKVETSIFGKFYTLKPPSELEGIELLQWLERSFKNIFRLAYSID